MNEVVVAIIAATPGLAAAAVSWLNARRTKSLAVSTRTLAATTERVRYQVENNHGTNLRDEQDARHQTTLGAITGLRDHFDKQLDGVRSDMRGVRRDVGRLADWQREHESESRDLIVRAAQSMQTVASLVERVEKIEKEKEAV